jgi:hypothetical protein
MSRLSNAHYYPPNLHFSTIQKAALDYEIINWRNGRYLRYSIAW